MTETHYVKSGDISIAYRVMGTKEPTLLMVPGDSQRLISQFGGRVVEVLGDGVLAEFPAPGDALRATRALVKGARIQGLQIRAGLHAGEVYQVGERLIGICVNAAARVADRAGAGEVLTTEIVRGLVEGGDFNFEDAGEFDLKGIGTRRLVRLV